MSCCDKNYDYSILWRPIDINKCRIRNRISMSGMGTFTPTMAEQYETESGLRYYEERAKGGIGLIHTGAYFIDEKTAQGGRTLDFSSDKSIPSGTVLTERVHRWGAKMFAQLSCGTGRNGMPQIGERVPISSSENPSFYNPSMICRPLSIEEIEEMMEHWKVAARNAMNMGFDGIQIHAHAGYLMDQFMSEIWNHRKDKYGGSFENRCRFTMETVDAIRSVVGPNFPITYRISLDHRFPGGRTLEESMKILDVLDKSGIDAFDIEVDTTDPEEFIRTVKAIAPTFGGINLEDIKAPECFEIETRLREELDIPLMHDDQHGTAIISSAALLNGAKIAGKELDKMRVVVNGAGAAAIACARLFVELGIRRENMVLCDSHGAVTVYREDINPMKREFATTRRITTLAEALHDADVFLGVSKADTLTPEMLRTMSGNPIVMALANPDPEIAYDTAMLSRPDIIFATGRSDYPNQVNNVLGFPYIFRGALDVRATKINEEMKLAAAHALAELTRQPVPTMVLRAYGVEKLEFGRTYLIPKPLDPRLLCTVAPAVAKAAVESGVAKQPIADWDAYAESLRKRYQE